MWETANDDIPETAVSKFTEKPQSGEVNRTSLAVASIARPDNKAKVSKSDSDLERKVIGYLTHRQAKAFAYVKHSIDPSTRKVDGVNLHRIRIRQDLSEREIIDEDFSVSAPEWENPDGLNNARTISRESHSAFQTHPSRTEIPRNRLQLLKKGDEIGWRRPAGYWHVAIINKVDTRNRRLNVFHYGSEGCNGIFKKEWIDVDEERGDLYRFDYSTEILNRNPVDLVLQRARSKIGEQKYWLTSNNCEHIATYCKTGRKESAQVYWVFEKLYEVYKTCVCIAKEKVKAWTADETADGSKRSGLGGFGSVAAAETFERLVNGSDVVGAAGVFALEAAFCYRDIYHIHKAMQEGKIKDRDYQVSVTQRVSQAVAASGLAVVRSIVGGIVCPVFGGFIGNVIGGALGSVAGKVSGTSVGLWIGNWLWPKDYT